MKKLALLMVAVVAIMVSGPSLAVASENDVVTSGTTILSPYWQADVNSWYTFIGISNPSVAGNVSRSVTVKAFRGVTTSDLFAGSVTLTVPLGRTSKVFIANTNHSSINSIAVTADNIHWISATGGGQLLIVSEYPYVPVDGAVGGATQTVTNTDVAGILSVWGAIISPTSSSGFAMEFIGDLTDSTTEQEGDLAGGM